QLLVGDQDAVEALARDGEDPAAEGVAAGVLQQGRVDLAADDVLVGLDGPAWATTRASWSRPQSSVSTWRTSCSGAIRARAAGGGRAARPAGPSCRSGPSCPCGPFPPCPGRSGRPRRAGVAGRLPGPSLCRLLPSRRPCLCRPHPDLGGVRETLGRYGPAAPR